MWRATSTVSELLVLCGACLATHTTGNQTPTPAKLRASCNTLQQKEGLTACLVVRLIIDTHPERGGTGALHTLYPLCAPDPSRAARRATSTISELFVLCGACWVTHTTGNQTPTSAKLRAS